MLSERARVRPSAVLGAAAMCLALSGGNNPAVAQVPLGSEWTYQGLLKFGGENVNGTADFEFSLWGEETGGNMIGDVVAIDNVTLVDGLFTVRPHFGVDSFNGQKRWVEIAVRSPAGVGKFTTLDQRQPLTATPYALQTRGIFVNDAGNVGVGATSPDSKLEVEGAGGIPGGNSNLMTIRSTADLATAITLDNFFQQWTIGQNRPPDAPNQLDDFYIYSHVDDKSHLVIRNSSGNVGIGTTTPSAKLDVVGTTELNGDVTINSNLQVDGSTLFVNGTSNRVGIGTTTPERGLHLQGQGSNGIFRIVRDEDAVGQLLVRTAPNDFDTVWKTFFCGVQADGPDSGKFFISDFHTSVAGGSDLRLTIDTAGNVGIGTTSPAEALHVCGNIRTVGDITASGSIIGSVAGACPDYVFEPDYELMPLDKLSEYIQRNKHLPNVPSAEVVERDGIDLGGFSMRLLEKTEELTLYVLDQDKRLKEKDAELAELRERLARIEEIVGRGT